MAYKTMHSSPLFFLDSSYLISSYIIPSKNQKKVMSEVSEMTDWWIYDKEKSLDLLFGTNSGPNLFSVRFAI